MRGIWPVLCTTRYVVPHPPTAQNTVHHSIHVTVFLSERLVREGQFKTIVTTRVFKGGRAGVESFKGALKETQYSATGIVELLHKDTYPLSVRAWWYYLPIVQH